MDYDRVEDGKVEVLFIRVTDKEKKTLAKESKRLGMSMSKIIAQFIRSLAK
jgi:antitoxin component of RelBE/YafQ-DinJ toxin-antitoxin module